MNIIGYRSAATGVFGYSFYVNQEIFCSLYTMGAPSAPVHIQGLGLDLVSKFDRDATLMPGVSRLVMEEVTGKEVFRYYYRSYGAFDILFPGGSVIRVSSSEYQHRFLLESGETATLTRMTGEPRRCGYVEEEPYFHAVVPEDMRAIELLAILSFPMLRFAL